MPDLAAPLPDLPARLRALAGGAPLDLAEVLGEVRP